MEKRRSSTATGGNSRPALPEAGLPQTPTAKTSGVAGLHTRPSLNHYLIPFSSYIRQSRLPLARVKLPRVGSRAPTCGLSGSRSHPNQPRCATPCGVSFFARLRTRLKRLQPKNGTSHTVCGLTTTVAPATFWTVDRGFSYLLVELRPLGHQFRTKRRAGKGVAP